MDCLIHQCCAAPGARGISASTHQLARPVNAMLSAPNIETSCASGARRAHSVQVCVSTIAMSLISLWHVVVDDDVDTLNVNASPNQISGHQDALLALLECLVHLQPA